MHRFFAYEEYGAKYELMVKDVASTSKTMPHWDMYQKGLEALATSLASINNQSDHTKRGLTVGDLLIKVFGANIKVPSNYFAANEVLKARAKGL